MVPWTGKFFVSHKGTSPSYLQTTHRELENQEIPVNGCFEIMLEMQNCS